MKLKLDTSPKDRILVELDGTVVTMFMRTGFLRSITRTKYACTDSAAVSAFSITSTKTNENATAPHALVFVVSMSLVRFLDSHHGSLAALDRIMRAAGPIDEERFQINDVR